MTNSISLPIVNGGIGASTPVSGLASLKTIVATGISGVVNIEASGDGAEWVVCTTLQSPDSEVQLTQAAAFMRVNATNGIAGNVQVIADQSIVRSATIPAPPTNGNGASLDISAFGRVATVYVGSFAGEGVIEIEASGDGTNWAQVLPSFTANGAKTGNIPAKFVRAVGKGATAVLSLSAEEPTASSFNSPLFGLIFKPGDPDGSRGNVYTDWSDLYAAFNSLKSVGSDLITIVLDSSFAPFNTILGENTITIPEGTWDLNGAKITNPRKTDFTGLTFADNCFIQGSLLFFEGYHLDIVGTSSVSSAFLIGDGTLNVGISGGGVEMFNSDTAKPLVKVIGDDGYLFRLGDESYFSIYGEPDFGPGYGPSIDLNGHVLELGNCQIQDGSLTDTSLAGGGTFRCLIQDYWAFTGDTNNASSLTWTFPDLPANTIFTPINTGRNRYGIPSVTPITSAQSPYSALLGQTILVDTGAAVTIQLSHAKWAQGEFTIVKDATGTASVHNITITPFAGDTIDGAASLVISSDFGSFTIVSDGVSNWYVIAKV